MSPNIIKRKTIAAVRSSDKLSDSQKSVIVDAVERLNSAWALQILALFKQDPNFIPFLADFLDELRTKGRIINTDELFSLMEDKIVQYETVPAV